MKTHVSLFLFALFFSLSAKAQNNDLSLEIVGDWLFQHAEVDEMLVGNPNVKDSITVQIAEMGQLIAGQVLTYEKDGVMRVTNADNSAQGRYSIDGNAVAYTFDGYSYQDTFSIEGDTLCISFDQTAYFNDEGYRLYPDEDNYDISKVITRYIYARRKD